MSEITVPVLIGGGGGAGLTASMLLSSYGMDSLLVRKYPGTSHLPKAHVLQQRTMEVYRELGVAEPIYARGTPPEHMAFTGWYAGVAGPTPEYGREIAQLECWGNGDSDPNWMKHLTTAQVLGMTPDKTPEENWEIMRQLWSDEPQAELLRVQFENAIASQAMEFYEQNVEYGYTYTSPAIVPDGTPAPQLIDDVHVYEPSTRPGSALPHAWLHRLGQRKALCDLAGHGQFLLITGEGGEGWIQAATDIAQEQGLPLKAISVNPFSGDWLRQREVSSEGAVLVRPDRHIAWRSFGASENPRAALEEALGQVLGAQQVLSR